MVRILTVLSDRSAVENAVAERLISEISTVHSSQEFCTVVLTGGTVGIGTLRAVAASPRRDTVDWNRVRVLWGDERYVPAGDSDRNDHQADEALLHTVAIRPANVMRFPSSDSGLSLDAAAESFSRTLAAAFPEGLSLDIALCGIGPDGHVASLFPGFDHGEGHIVIPVPHSPKPPAERLSLTFTALNQARKMWIVCAGHDKADAVQRLMSNELNTTPAVALNGTEETVVFADTEAASLTA